MRIKWKGWDNPCCFSQEKLEKKYVFEQSKFEGWIKRKYDFISSLFIKYETI